MDSVSPYSSYGSIHQVRCRCLCRTSDHCVNSWQSVSSMSLVKVLHLFCLHGSCVLSPTSVLYRLIQRSLYRPIPQAILGQCKVGTRSIVSRYIGSMAVNMLADTPPQLDRYVSRVATPWHIGSISAVSVNTYESANVSTDTQPYVSRVSVIFVMSVMHY